MSNDNMPEYPPREILFGDGDLKYIRADTIDQLRQSHAELLSAAKAVIERWNTPNWKDAPATAIFINQLRDAADSAEELQK